MAPKLGIIAGSGDIPAQVIQACKDENREFFVIAFDGYADPEIVKDVPHEWVRLGAAGKGFEILKQQQVKEIVMIGGVRRPSFADLKPDWKTTRFFAKVGKKALGDDGLLSAVVAEFEAEGFKVIGVDEILGKLLAEEGVYGKVEPDELAKKDITHGMTIAKGIGALDIGQAVVIQEGLVLGVEAIEGTDALLARVKDLKRQGTGGVLVKARKPEQERRVDLPTIGVSTVINAHEAGLCGIVVEAGNALLVNREKIIETADKLGLFIIGVKASV